MSTSIESVKNILKETAKDSFYFLKIIAPIMLIASFVIVFKEYFKLHSDQILSEYFRQALAVPLILFGIMAILNIMLFVKPGACMFLALFFIGSFVSGPELAEKGAKLAAATFSNTVGQYAEVLGGIGTSNYTVGGGIKVKKIEDAISGKDKSKDIKNKDNHRGSGTDTSPAEENDKKTKTIEN